MDRLWITVLKHPGRVQKAIREERYEQAALEVSDFRKTLNTLRGELDTEPTKYQKLMCGCVYDALTFTPISRLGSTSLEAMRRVLERTRDTVEATPRDVAWAEDRLEEVGCALFP